MSYTNGERLRFYVFIQSKEGVTGIEVTDGTLNMDTEMRDDSDGWAVNRTPTGVRYITLRGKAGASQHFDHMPDGIKVEQELIGD
jgi:hypothetical protein